MSAEIIPIFAAISPKGEIVKTSISTFRQHALRYAHGRKNFSVVKLAEINASIMQPEPAPVPEIAPQTVTAKVEIPRYETKQKRKYTRRNKPAA